MVAPRWYRRSGRSAGSTAIERARKCEFSAKSRTPAHVRRQGSALADQFLVDELVDAETPEFTPEPGPLDPAERQLDPVGADEVDEHHPGLELVGHPAGLLVVGGEHV